MPPIETPLAEPAAEPAAEPTNSLAAVPDVASEMAGETFSFEDIIEQAIAGEPAAAEPVAGEPVAAVEPVAGDPADGAEPVAGEPAEPAEPIESLTEEIGEDWTPKASVAFQREKGKVKDLTLAVQENATVIRELEAKNKELAAQVGDNTREAMQERIEKFERDQMINNLESSNAYADAVTKPLQSIADQATDIAERYGANANDLLEAMAIKDETVQAEKISELLVDATDRDRGRIYGLIEQVDPILKRRVELRENVEAANNEATLLAEQQEAQRIADAVEIRGNVARNVIARIGQKVPFIKTLEGIDLGAIEESVAGVDISTANPVDQVYSGVATKILPPLISSHVRLQREVDALTAKLAEYDDAEPTISSKGVITNPSNPSATVEGESFNDSIERAIAEGV